LWIVRPYILEKKKKILAYFVSAKIWIRIVLSINFVWRAVKCGGGGLVNAIHVLSIDGMNWGLAL